MNRKAVETPSHSHYPPSSNRFLDTEEAASFLGGLNGHTVARWAREGYLPAFPLGEGKRRLWRFLEADLTEWMSARRTGAAGTLLEATDAPFKGHRQ